MAAAMNHVDLQNRRLLAPVAGLSYLRSRGASTYFLCAARLAGALVLLAPASCALRDFEGLGDGEEESELQQDAGTDAALGPVIHPARWDAASAVGDGAAQASADDGATSQADGALAAADAQAQDAGTPGSLAEAGGVSDAGTAEAGPIDASSGVPDAALPPRDAGPPADAGKPDSGPPPPVGQSNCYTKFANRLMCEGFEAELGQPWERNHSGGETLRASSPTHVGGGALAARTTASGGVGFVARPAFSNVRAGSVFLRSYVYMPSGPALTGVVLHGVSEEVPPYGGVSVLVTETGFTIDVHPKGPGVAPVFISSNPQLTLQRNRWNCVQLEVGVSASAGAVKLRVNGTLVAESAAPLPTLPPGGFRNVSAGIVYSYAAQVPAQIFVDELVADLASIPCDAVPVGGPLEPSDWHGE